MAMRSLGSISSELCEMQALRDSNLALGAKDLEWQRRIAGPRHVTGLAQPMENFPQFSFDFYSRPYTNTEDANESASAAGGCGFGSGAIPNKMRREQSTASSAPSSSVDSGSSHGALPDSDAGERRRGDGCRKGRVGKIRRHRMTKEEEARFNPVDLRDLKGSTAAKSRKMTDEERDIMLHKRRLRNRQSAARSRSKQRKTIGDVSEEVDELVGITQALKERCEEMQLEMGQLRNIIDALRKENHELQKAGGNTITKQSSGFWTVSTSSDMLDKIIGGEALIHSSSMLRIPSKSQMSVGVDKLAVGDSSSTQLVPLSRDASVLERLWDIAGNADPASSDRAMYDSMNANSNSDTTATF